MSKIIKLTPEYIDECVEEFRVILTKERVSSGTLTYKKVLGTVERKAVLKFTEEAYLKMEALVDGFDKEVAWHGVVERSDEKDEYLVSDILVYPQKTSGAFVDMDVEEYEKWLRENSEDERFYNIRMQGHSHVNMAAQPSGTDLSHQETILKQLATDGFYVFVILNKRGEKFVRIYDLKENIMFETEDVDIEIEGGYDLKGFTARAKDMVKDFAGKPADKKTADRKLDEKKDKKSGKPAVDLTQSSRKGKRKIKPYGTTYYDYDYDYGYNY